MFIFYTVIFFTLFAVTHANGFTNRQSSGVLARFVRTRLDQTSEYLSLTSLLRYWWLPQLTHLKHTAVWYSGLRPHISYTFSIMTSFSTYFVSFRCFHQSHKLSKPDKAHNTPHDEPFPFRIFIRFPFSFLNLDKVLDFANECPSTFLHFF